MSKSLKMNNDNYIDSTGIVHNKRLLSTIIEKLSGTVLFENTNGAVTGTLNDNYTNYEKIVVKAIMGSSNPFCIEGVLFPTKTNRIDLSLIQSDLSSDSNNKTYFATSRFIFNTNSFSMQTSANWYEPKATGIPTNINYDTAPIKIYKIIGYI